MDSALCTLLPETALPTIPQQEPTGRTGPGCLSQLRPRGRLKPVFFHWAQPQALQLASAVRVGWWAAPDSRPSLASDLENCDHSPPAALTSLLSVCLSLSFHLFQTQLPVAFLISDSTRLLSPTAPGTSLVIQWSSRPAQARAAQMRAGTLPRPPTALLVTRMVSPPVDPSVLGRVRGCHLSLHTQDALGKHCCPTGENFQKFTEKWNEKISVF